MYLEIVWRNAAAVIDDLKGLLAEFLQGNLDAGGTGVQAVLHKLLDGGREVQNHLAGADSVDCALADRLYRRRCYS